MDIKECKRKFYLIMKEREKAGYVEWKKWTVEQVKDYEYNSLVNLVKRCEIEYKKYNEHKGFEIFPVWAQILSCILVVLPSISTIIFSVFSIQSGIYQEALEKSAMQEYASIVYNTITKLSTDIISQIVVVASVAMILLSVVRYIDDKITNYHNMYKIFLEELIIVLKKCMKNLKKDI